MDSLREIVSCLDRREVCLIKSNFRLQKDKSNGKRLQLFELIRENKVESDEQAAKILYKSKPNAAYSNLKQRLRQSILSFVLSQQNMKRTSLLTQGEAKVDCLRLLTMGQILVSREAFGEAEKVLKYAEELIVRFELRTEQLLLEELYQSHSAFSDRFGLTDFHQRHLDSHFLQVQFSMEARACCNELEECFNTGKLLDEGQWPTLKNCQSNLRQLDATELNPVNTFWYHYLTALMLRYEGKFDQAFVVAHELIQVVKDFPSNLQCSDKFAAQMLFVHLSSITKQEKQYRAQIAYLTEVLAKPNVPWSNLRYVQCLHALNNHQEAQAESMFAEVHTELPAKELSRRPWKLIELELLFRQGAYKKVLSGINSISEALNGDSLLAYEIRIMELLSLLQLKKHELFEYRLEAANQFMKRRKAPELDPYRHILNVLKTMRKMGYGNAALEIAFQNHYPERIKNDPKRATIFVDFAKWVEQCLGAEQMAL